MAGTMEGKVVLATGAGRCVGRGIALEMAKAVAAVVVNDLGVSLQRGRARCLNADGRFDPRALA